jgi:hypothetical protein
LQSRSQSLRYHCAIAAQSLSNRFAVEFATTLQSLRNSCDFFFAALLLHNHFATVLLLLRNYCAIEL